MYPELFSIGGLTVYSYGVFMVIAVVSGYFFLVKTAALRYIKEKTVSYFFTGAVIWGLIGARLFYVIIDMASFISNPLEVFAIWGGGLVFSGAFLGGAGWIIYSSRKKKVRFLDICDVTVPALSLGYAIARIGCFMSGCCYGSETAGCCGVVFPGHTYPSYPVQLYSMVASGMISVILYRALKSPLMKRGTVFSLYLVLYGSFRVAIEFLRGDFRGEYILFFTPTQWIAFLGAGAGLYMLIKFSEKKDIKG